MELNVRQISSLEKVRAKDVLNQEEICQRSVLAGERFSYQLCMNTDAAKYKPLYVNANVESAFAACVQLFAVKEIYMDHPVVNDFPMEDYITKEPGMMPDMLMPLEVMTVDRNNKSIWVRVDIPKDVAAGVYVIKIKLTFRNLGGDIACIMYKDMKINVIGAVMPEQRLIYTRWFYADCVAVTHGVEIYSEKHWELIEKYIAAAADVGVNMMLVPTHTPPLDTEIGTARPCVQLVDIEKNGEKYTFSFSKFKRYIGICKKCGIKYFEIAHMFSQWGADCAPNIMVTENGKTNYMFGWHVAANSAEYVTFLKQYIKAISEELVKEGISENTYFHISDEPHIDNLEAYRTASELIRPLIGKSKTFDALSNYTFYERGFVECPVTNIRFIHDEFLKHSVPNQWAYYACGGQETVTNCLMAMPSGRTRIIGFLLYKYNIKGFLHWGLNFYNACRSLYPINPYQTTSADKHFPSGDPFIVYPGNDCVYSSIRGEVLYDAIQDMNICFALENLIGREAVVEMIDAFAERELRFDDYPRSREFLEGLREKLVGKINECIAGITG